MLFCSHRRVVLLVFFAWSFSPPPPNTAMLRTLSWDFSSTQRRVVLSDLSSSMLKYTQEKSSICSELSIELLACSSWDQPTPPHQYNRTRPLCLLYRRPKPQKSPSIPLTCHIEPISYACWPYLQSIFQSWPVLTPTITILIRASKVFSVDYCSSLPAGLLETILTPIQFILQGINQANGENNKNTSYQSTVGTMLASHYNHNIIQTSSHGLPNPPLV